MRSRRIPNVILVALSGLMWFGLILPDLQRLQSGVLEQKNGYLYYGRTLAIFNLASAIIAIIAIIVLASMTTRGSSDEQYRSVTIGVIGVLIIQSIIMTMIPLGFLLGIPFH